MTSVRSAHTSASDLVFWPTLRTLKDYTYLLIYWHVYRVVARSSG